MLPRQYGLLVCAFILSFFALNVRSPTQSLSDRPLGDNSVAGKFHQSSLPLSQQPAGSRAADSADAITSDKLQFDAFFDKSPLQDETAGIGTQSAFAPESNTGTLSALLEARRRPATDTLPVAASFLSVNPVEFELLRRAVSAQPVRQQLVLPTGQNIVVNLEPFAVLADDAVVVAASADSETPFQPEPLLLFRGQVERVPASHVYLAVTRDHASGYISLPAGTSLPAGRFVIAPLGPPTAGPSLMILYDEDDAPLPQRTTPGCATADLPGHEEAVQEMMKGAGRKRKDGGDQVQSTETLVLNVAVDCDTQFFADHGSNLSRAVNYALTVMGAVSALYYRDMNVVIRVPYLRVFRSSDPYHNSNASTMLSQLRTEWNTNKTSIDRSLAHLFSGNGSIGGIAWLGSGVLCGSKTNGYGFGVSGLDNNINFPTTAYAWDTDVTAHELGHNVGSPHTHSCAWEPAIDSCYFAQHGTCFSSWVATRGTIMSYCHLRSAGKDLRMHPIVATHLRGNCESASCIYPETKSAAKDVAVMAIELPREGGKYATGATFTPAVVFANIGTDDQSGLSVELTLDDWDGNEVYSSTGSIDLDAGERLHFTFAPTSIATTGDYFVTADISLTSDANVVNNKLYRHFEVVASVAGSLSLTSHNVADTLIAGANTTIKWTQSGLSRVRLEYTPDDGAHWHAIRFSQTASTGQFTWEVAGVPTTEARIRVSDRDNAALFDVSDETFIIDVSKDIQPIEFLDPPANDKDTAAFIPRVVFRNNGDSEQTDVSARFRLVSNVLRQETFVTFATISSIAAGARDTLDFPEANVHFSGDYIMYVKAMLDDDENPSNDSLARSTELVRPTISVTAPNGGEVWQTGTDKTISWNDFGNVNDVRIAYSTNGGLDWTILVQSTSNTGSYVWEIPDAPGSATRVRISDARYPLVNDQSNSSFSIQAIDPPDDLQALHELPDARLSWTASGAQNIDGYIVYRGAAPDALVAIDTVDSDSLNYTDPNRTIATVYYYAVRTKVGPYLSANSNTALFCYIEPELSLDGPSSYCADNPSTLDAGPDYLSYLWSDGSTTRTIAPVTSGSYSVQVTDANGCSGITSSITLTVYASPTPTISADGPVDFCTGGTVRLDAGGPYDSYLWSNGAVTRTIDVSSSGSYQVTVANAQACLGSSTQIVNVYPLPEPAISPDGPTEFCADESRLLDAGAGYSSYQWSNGASTRSISVSASAVYIVTVANIHLCTAATSVTLTVHPLPEPTISADGPLTFCSGGSVTLDAGAGFSSYRWSNGATSRSIQVSSTGQYGVTVANLNNCEAASTVSVTVFPRPNVIISADGPLTFCSGGSVTLDAGAGYASYLWSNGATSQSIVATSSASYQVTAATHQGCTGASIAVVSVEPLPAPQITADGPTAFCEGGAVVLDAGPGYASYRWSNAATTQTIRVTSSANYTVTVATAFGCEQASAALVIVYPLPEPTISTNGPTEFCTGASVVLDAGPGFASYQWSDGSSSQTLLATTGGEYRVTVATIQGCTAATAISVTVHPLPAPLIQADGPDEICDGESLTLDAGAGFASYEWSNGATSQTIIVQQTGHFTVTVANVHGCSGSDEFSVTVHPLPDAVIQAGGPTSFCAGGTVLLDAGAGVASYAWSNGATTQTILVSTGAVYSVTVASAQGCDDSSSITVTVHPLPSPLISVDGTTAICAGDSVVLNAPSGFASYLWSDGSTAAELSVTSAGIYKVTVWDAKGCTGSAASPQITVLALPTPIITSDGPTSFCADGSVILDAGAAYASYAWSNGATSQTIQVATAATYRVTVANAQGCRAATEALVTVYPLPAPAITADGPTTFCAGGSVILDAGAGFASYQWSNGATTQSINASEGALYVVTVASVEGCSAASSALVTVLALPEPQISADGPTSFCPGASVTLDAGAGYAEYRWSNGATSQTIVVTSASHNVVTVANADGCEAASSLSVSIFEAPTPQIAADGPLEFCTGGSVNLDAGAGYASYAWSNGATSQTIIAESTGLYTVSVATLQGCSASSSVQVTVQPLPGLLLVADGPTEFCAGGDVQLDAGAGHTTYRWSNGATTQSIMVMTTGSYSVTVANSQGCFASSGLSVTVHPLPQPVMSADGPTAFCSGASVQLDAGAGFASYRWSNGASTQTISVSEGALYTVTVAGVHGCENTTSMLITVYAQPSPVISALGPTQLCAGQTVQLEASAGFADYEWSNGATTQVITVGSTGLYAVTVRDANGCRATSAAIDVTVLPPLTPLISADGPTEFCAGGALVLDAGPAYSAYEWSNGATSQSITATSTGIFTVSVQSSEGCIASSSVTVTVNPLPLPVIDADGPTAFCAGGAVLLDAGAGYAEYEWSDGATSQSISVNTSGLYTVTVANSKGCKAASSLSVTVYPLPRPSISAAGPTEFCAGGAVLLDAGGAYSAYLWSNGATTQTITVTTANVYTVTVANTSGCKASSSQSVTVHALPLPSISADGPTSFCAGESRLLDAGAGFDVYAWSNGASSQTISVAESGLFTVTVANSSGCEASSSLSLTVHPLPSPSISADGPTEFCAGGTVELDAGAGYASYSWSNGASTQTIIAASTALLRVTVANIFGCRAETTQSVTVYDRPSPVIVSDGPSSFCAGETLQLETDQSYAGYRWSNGATASSIIVASSGSYSVTVIDANGCEGSSASLNVTVYPAAAPQISADGPTMFCDGGSVTLDAGAGFTAYQWSNGATSQTISVTEGGDYSVTVTTANGCEGSSTQSVTIYDLPRPILGFNGPTSFCAGEELELDAGEGFASYRWSNGASTQTIVVHETALYTVTVASLQGCLAATAQSVTVYPLPVPTITADGPTKLCPGEVLTLTADAGYQTYLWSNGATTQSIVVGTAASYLVSVSDHNGCRASAAALSVSYHTAPTVTIAGDGPSVFCEGEARTLDAGAGFVSYRWSDGSSSQTITVSTSGDFSVRVTDANGCSTSSAISLQVIRNPRPVIAADGSLAFCAGGSVELDAGVGYAAYRWSNGATSQTIVADEGGEWRVTVATLDGCEGSSALTVTVYTRPMPVITSDGPIALCPGETVTLNAGPGYKSYLWSNGATSQTIVVDQGGSHTVTVQDDNNCSGSSAEVRVTLHPTLRPILVLDGPAAFCAGTQRTLDAGFGYSSYLWSNGAKSQSISVGASGDYSVTVTNANGCTGSSSVSITVRPLPEVLISSDGPTSFCSGGSVQLDAGVGFAGYAWSNGARTQTIDVSDGGDYSVTVVDDNGCTGSSSISISVWPLPSPSISADGPVDFCVGQSLELDAGSGYSSYAWSNGATTQTIQVSETAVYRVTVANANNCQASTSIGVTVHELPNPQIDAGGQTAICSGASLVLDAGPGYASYAWSNGLQTQSIEVSQAGNYTVTVATLVGCTAATSISIALRPSPAPLLTLDGPAAFCAGTQRQLDAGAGYSSYLWSNGATTQTIQVGTSGSYHVTVTNEEGCQGQSPPISITVFTLPVASAGTSVTICAGNSVQLQAAGGLVYRWSPVEGLSDPSIADPIASPTTTTTYSVEVGNAQGCTSSASLTVEVLPVRVALSVFLEGAYAAPALRSNLNSLGMLPLSQPYALIPPFYAGTESVAVIPADIVDWVIVEIRSAADRSELVTRRAAFLRNDGAVVDLDGVSAVGFAADALPAGAYHVVIRQRNHLSLMTALARSPEGDCHIVQDFRSDAASAFEWFQAPQAQLPADALGMITGDVNADGIINARDRVEVRRHANKVGYLPYDVNLDGVVNSSDRILVRDNSLRASQVP